MKLVRKKDPFLESYNRFLDGEFWDFLKIRSKEHAKWEIFKLWFAVLNRAELREYNEN